MKKRASEKIWIPFWVDKWLFGSMRIECTVEERAVWIDFLALAAKDDGWIRANEDTAYPMDQLAGYLRIPKDKLQKAINKFVRLKKIKRHPNKTLYVVTWEKYQFSERHKRRVMAGDKDIAAEKEDTITKDNISNNNKEHNKDMVEINFEKHLWKPWPEEGRYKKKICLMKYRALCKAGKEELFRKVTAGYAAHLKTKEEREHFKQQVMHLATWLNNWEGEIERYINVKYEPPL